MGICQLMQTFIYRIYWIYKSNKKNTYYSVFTICMLQTRNVCGMDVVSANELNPRNKTMPRFWNCSWVCICLSLFYVWFLISSFDRSQTNIDVEKQRHCSQVWQQNNLCMHVYIHVCICVNKYFKVRLLNRIHKILEDLKQDPTEKKLSGNGLVFFPSSIKICAK